MSSLEEKLKRIKQKLESLDTEAKKGEIENKLEKNLIEKKDSLFKNLSDVINNIPDKKMMIKVANKEYALKDLKDLMEDAKSGDLTKNFQDKIHKLYKNKLQAVKFSSGNEHAKNLYDIFKSFFDFDSLWIIEKPLFMGAESTFVDFGFNSEQESESFFRLIKICLEKLQKEQSSNIIYCGNTTSESDQFGVFYNNFNYKSVLILPIDQGKCDDGKFINPLRDITYQTIGLNSQRENAFTDKDIQFMYTIVNLFYSRESMSELLTFSSNFLVSILYNLPVGMVGITEENEIMILNNAVYDLLEIQGKASAEEPGKQLGAQNYPIEAAFSTSEKDELLGTIERIRTGEEKKAKIKFWLEMPDGKRKLIKGLIFSLKSNASEDGKANLELYMLIEDITNEYQQIRLQEELEIARNVQKSFLPQENFVSERIETYGVTYPAKEVGGDYYDFIAHDNYLNIAIADVTGKGVSASMVMSSLKSSLQTLIKSETPFANVIPSLNETIYENTLPEMFITMFYGRVDQETNEFVYCNGGHNYPILIRHNGDIELLKAGGLILGIFPDSNYEIATLRLESGDTVLCYTDGITEAINSQNEEYSDGRLLNFVKENRKLSPESLIKGIIDDVSEFQGKARQYDDITLFALKMR